MRLVIRYEIGDGYTFNATETVPVECESGEFFAVEFERLCKCVDRMENEFLFCGKTWYVPNHMHYNRDREDFYYEAPIMLTVDEWFEEK